MATYIVGDLQGCAESLKALLKRCRFGADDELWCVGDLVNRGPHSLEALELLYELGDRARVVLGNHDLHLLACSAGAERSRGDSLDEVLAHPQRERYLEWLRERPLLYEDEARGVAMLHAGLNPEWSWAETRSRARRVERALQAKGGLEELAYHHPSRKRHRALTSSLTGSLTSSEQGAGECSEEPPEWIKDLAWLTRVRFICDGEVDERLKGGPHERTPTHTPWYERYEESVERFGDRPNRLFVGHWAALGLYQSASLTALDTGCIWGRYLSALRLEDGAIFQQSTVEYALVAQHQRG